MSVVENLRIVSNQRCFPLKSQWAVLTTYREPSFRRVPTKTSKAVFYLFFRREEDTYYALRTAKSIKNISVVRYRHYNTTAAPVRRPDDVPQSEMQYRPVPPKNIVDTIRHSFTKYYDQFANKV